MVPGVTRVRQDLVTKQQQLFSHLIARERIKSLCLLFLREHLHLKKRHI